MHRYSPLSRKFIYVYSVTSIICPTMHLWQNYTLISSLQIQILHHFSVAQNKESGTGAAAAAAAMGYSIGGSYTRATASTNSTYRYMDYSQFRDAL